MIKNCDLDLCSRYGATIITYDGSISLTGCTGTVTSESDDDEALIIENIDYLYLEDYDCNKDYTVSITDCTLKFSADEEAIQSFHGGITLKNSDLNVYSETEEGIHAAGVGDITVSGGRLVVISHENCLESDGGMVNLSNVNLTLVASGDYAIIRNDGNDIDLTKFSIPGKFKLMGVDANGDEELLYEGEWKPELLDSDGQLTVDGVEPAAVISVLADGKKEGVTADLITGLNAEYTKGDKLGFKAAEVPVYPVEDTVGFAPYKWEIAGTKLSGEWSGDEAFSAFVSTADLAAGTYTLKVTYAKGEYNAVFGWVLDKDSDGNLKETVTVEKTFTVKNPPVNSDNGGTATSPKTGDSTKPFAAAVVLALSAGAVLVLRKKVRG